MKLQNIGKTLSLGLGRTGLLLKKHSPEILMATGVAGIVTSTVLACRATLKADEVLDNAKVKLDKIHEAKEQIEKMDMNDEPHISYSEQDYKKDLAVTYLQTGWDFVKLYGPAVTLGLASIACMVTSHGIMRKRNLALVAAYKAVEESFSQYRKRVVEELGEEKDRQFKYGIKKEKVSEVAMDEDGNEVVNEKEVETIDPNGISQYARFFDESSTQWSKTPEYNMQYVLCQQRYANDLLNSKGHLFLNEVYDMLGLERSQAGTIVGWVKGNGDNYVDFGIFDEENEAKRAFVNGHERSILLDFNVDGIIYNLI
jgi:hypothetical protein